jgi:predicted O-methyltransferase YrrM
MIIKEIYIYEKICGALRNKILDYIINTLKITKDEFHNFNGNFYITSSINILIDYNNCFNNKKEYLDNYLLNYEILVNMKEDFPRLKTNNIIEIYTNDAGHFSKTGESKYLTLFSDVLRYYNCINNIYKSDNMSIVLLDGTREDLVNNDWAILDKADNFKFDKKYTMISVAISIPNRFNIIMDECENTIIRNMNKFILYVSNQLKKGGSVKIFISKFYFSVLKMLKYICKYFETVKVYRPKRRALNIIEFRTNHCYLLYNYNGVKMNELKEDDYKDININDFINDYVITYKNEYNNLRSYEEEIYKIKTQKELLNYYIMDKIKYVKEIGLRVNPEYIILFQYNTWKRVLNSYIKNDNKYNILEIGCYEGLSSVWFLSNVMSNVDSRLYCVDTWEGSVEYNNVNFDNIYNKFLKNIKSNSNYKENKVIISRKRSDKFLLEMTNMNQSLVCNNCLLFDIIFIDASHDSRDVIMDSILSWRLLKVGGVLIWDDYIWEKMPKLNERPKMAIDSFLMMFEGNYKILSKTTQLIVQKTKEYYFS